jgi:hypothetical protein
MNQTTLLNRIWKLLCSLKVAIVLASAATLLIMGGSLLMPFNPRLFGHMDQLALGDWLRTTGAAQPELTWWVFFAGALILLLGLNTLCCFIDWVRNLRARWRKSGEYLIHLGFILILVAYVWGSLAGFRSEGNRIFVGEVRKISALPGYSLRLEAFEPQLGPGGRPIDMLSTVALLHDDRVLKQKIVKSNDPLTHGGLVVVPASFGRQPAGFTFFLAGRGAIPLAVGSEVELGGSRLLRVLDFYPDAFPRADGQADYRGDTLGNPAIRLELHLPGQETWRGWFFLRGEIPYPLLEAGVRLWPTEPLYRIFSELTVNYDPGAPLALAGAAAMLIGVILAVCSFYYKRGRDDRPEVV